MKVINYNPVDEHSGCAFRSVSKALDISYDEAKQELYNYAIYNGDTDDVVEKFLHTKGFVTLEDDKGKKVKELKLKGVNVIYCFKDDWKHYVCVIDDNLYDKFDKALDLEVIQVFHKK